MNFTRSNFKGKRWQEEIDVRNFVQENYSPYTGGADFLKKATKRTRELWQQSSELLKAERENNGVLAIDTKTVADINAYDPGYLDQEKEIIVGLQTDQPLKRTLNTYGGIRMARQAAAAYGQKVDPEIDEIFTKYRKTHNDGVYDAYTPEIRAIRRSGVISGLPDAYGRGRIIGDYRRIALYGVDKLIEAKKEDKANLKSPMTEKTIRLREEVSEQLKALKN